MKGRKIFGEGKIFGLPRSLRTKKANEETICSTENKKNGERKGGKSIGEGKGHAQTNRHVGDRARSLDSLFAKIHHHHNFMSMI